MLKRSKLISLGLFFVLAGLLLFPNLALAQAKIEFTEKSFDLGQMYQKQEKSHIFKFKNVGTETLKIEKVKGS